MTEEPASAAMPPWQHETLAQRVRFATGGATVALRDELGRLGANRVMLIASRTQPEVDRITEGLPVVTRQQDVVMHVPVDVAVRARTAATDHAVDAVVTVGGGSATGLGKAVALTTGLPLIAVPTTYAGSEATNVWGLTENGRKTTGVDPHVLPVAVVYDATLTVDLPLGLSVASGLNALAHCVDSMWGPRSDPIDRALAAEGVRTLAHGLPQLLADPAGLAGRERTLYAAYLSATAFSSAGSGLHHKICHALGGIFDLPHAQTHAVVLPYVLAFNAPAAPEAERQLARAFGCGTALAGLQRLCAAVDAPRALRDYGFDESGIATAAAAILPTIPANNPRPVTEPDLRRLLRAALTGEDPVTLQEETR